MAKNFEHIIHKNSNVTTNGLPKLPTSSQIEYGELAVNYAKDKETISLKNSNNEIVTFSSDRQIIETVEAMIPKDYVNQYLTFVALEDGRISFNIWKSMGTDMITSISYSTDNGKTWITTNNTNGKSEHLTISVNVNEGDKVMWKGDAQQTGYNDEDDYTDYVGSFFSSDCEFNVQGNVMSLLYGDNFIGETTLEESGAFACLFYDYEENYFCNVVDASNLVLLSTTLTDFCYNAMFRGCSGLTSAPQLPATTLATACYSTMFYYCTSLTTAPQLPATTLAERCYVGMFVGCAALTIAPQLPATTLANSCYRDMFYECTSLTSAPQLPATTLTTSCYYAMFKDCTSLTTAPELPATTLVNNCYSHIFNGCTQLNFIKAMFTTVPSTTYTYSWVGGVAATGTFVKNSAATWNVSGDYGIPNGWEVYTEEEYSFVRGYELKLSDDYEMNSGSNEDLFLEGGDSFDDAFGKLEKAMVENEYIISTALTELNDNLEEVSDKIDSSLLDYAPIVSPSLSGTPTAPTASVGNSSTQIATTAFVDSAINCFNIYGTSSTAASTVMKEVSIPAIKVLNVGQVIIVSPSVTSTVANSTLKLNSFDPYPMRYNNAAITTSTDSIVWSDKFPSMFLFDGTYWVFLGHGLDSNTTYSVMTQAQLDAGDTTTGRLIGAQMIRTNFYTKTEVDNLISGILPSFTSADEGKILSIVNGSLAWVMPASVYTGSGTPSSSQGNNGDIYLQTS